MTTYTREELREAADCLQQFKELFLQEDKSRKPELFAMATDILNQLAEAKPKEALIAAFNRGYAYIDQRDKVTYVGPLVDALGFYHPGFYKLPIKESNE